MTLCNIIKRITQYTETIRRLKPSQIYYRLRKYFGLNCTIGCEVGEFTEDVYPIETIPSLDFDSTFLSRFFVEDLMEDRFTFLHTGCQVNTNEPWDQDGQSALWNFNLHYFEYLFPLWNAYQTSGERSYLDKAFELISRWIQHNPRKCGGAGWEVYTVDLRLINWLNFYSYAHYLFPEKLCEMFIKSIYEQYVFLSEHIEKDILGNHYFEDLKSLVFCAIFFRDDRMLNKAVFELQKECREEILADGVHFERSMMYHNLILEGLLRVNVALRRSGHADTELEVWIQPMLDAAWSLEGSIDRLPLFNDAGNNVAKGIEALLLAAEENFSLKPIYRSQFPEAGYYLYHRGRWKLIIDAGDPGPSYIPGHTHCDALSFELFRDGKPVIVNCGTYAYQSQYRDFFRSTAAHNTTCVNGVEQSQFWGVFRLAKRSSVQVISANDKQLSAVLTDQAGQTVTRSFDFGDDLIITDQTENGTVTSYCHPLDKDNISFACESLRECEHMYAPEYGKYSIIKTVEYTGVGMVSLHIPLEK